MNRLLRFVWAHVNACQLRNNVIERHCKEQSRNALSHYYRRHPPGRPHRERHLGELMELEDMLTVLFLTIAECGSTPGIDAYITAAQGNDPRATSRAWFRLTEEEQQTIQDTYRRIQA